MEHDTVHAGRCRDVEGDGLPSALADGDDGILTDDVDNGDGVVIPELVPGGQVVIEVTASEDARLDAFIDFDGDGQFGPNEKVLDNVDLFNLDASGRDVTFASSTGEVAMTNDDRLLVLSTGAGLPPAINAIDGVSGDLNLGFSAYDNAFLGGVRVATGDVNADGTSDIITGPGAGGGPHVRVFDGTSGEVIREFFAFDANFRGGVFVASADLNNDGHDDIIIGADAGGGPHVRVIDGANGGELHSFYPFDPNFTGVCGSRRGMWMAMARPISSRRLDRVAVRMSEYSMDKPATKLQATSAALPPTIKLSRAVFLWELGM